MRWRPVSVGLAAVHVVTTAAWVLYALYARYQASWTVLAKEQWRYLEYYFAAPFPANVLLPTGGHLQAVSGTVHLADLWLFGGENRLSLLVGNGLQLAAAVSISVVVWRDGRLDPPFKGLCLTLVWVPTYWLAAIRIQGHVFIVELGLVSVALLVAVHSLERLRRTAATKESSRHWGSIALAGSACLVASASFGSGLATWPVLLVLALLVPLRRMERLALAAISAIGFGVSTLLITRDPPAIQLDPLVLAVDLSTWLGSPLHRVLRSFGSPAADQAGLLTMTGAGLLAAAVGLLVHALRRRRELSRLEIWALAMAFFGIGCGALVCAGRGHHQFAASPEARLAPRYLVWVVFTWMGVALLAVARARRWRPRSRALLLTAALALPALLLPSHLRSWKSHRAINNDLRVASVALALGIEDPLTARTLFRDPRVVRRGAALLEEHGLAMFAWPIADRLGRPLREGLARRGEMPLVGRLPGRRSDRPRLEDGVESFQGWLLAGAGEELPAYVLAADLRGVVRGAGVVTAYRPRLSLRHAPSGGRIFAVEGFLVDAPRRLRFFALDRDGVGVAPIQRAPAGQGRRGRPDAERSSPRPPPT